MTTLNKRENIILLTIPLVATIFVLIATRFNIGVSPDTTSYISAAQSLIDTGEIRSIKDGSHMAYMTHYPPGYSIVLTAFNIITNNLYEAARYSNATFLFLLLFSVGLVLRNYISLFYTLVLQLFLLTNLSFFTIYEMAWSEPSYMFFSFIGLYSLYLFVKSNAIKWLIISSVIMSLSISIRYLGITLIMSSVIYLWFALSNQTILKRLKYIVIHGSISSLFFLYWMIRNLLLENKSTNREISFHPMTIDYYEDLLNFTNNFFLSKISGSTLSFILGAILLLGIILYTIQVVKNNVREFKSLLLIYPASYMLFLFISNTFFDFTPLYYRILSPIFIFILISFFIHLFPQENKRFKKFRTIILLILLFFHSKDFTAHIKYIKDGKQYSSKKYMIPSTIAALNNIPKNSEVYTNGVDRIYFLTKGLATDWIDTLKPEMKRDYYVAYFKSGRTIRKKRLNSISHTRTIVTDTEDIIIYLYKKNN